MQLRTCARALLVSFLIASVLSQLATAAPATLPPSQVLVRWNDGVSYVGGSLAARRAVVVALTEVNNTLTVTSAFITGSGAEGLALNRALSSGHLGLFKRALERSGLTQYVENDSVVTIDPVTDTVAVDDAQWGISNERGGLNVRGAWEVTQGAGSVVAVLSTGIRPDPALDPNVLPGYDFIRNMRLSVDGDGRDADPTDPGGYNEVNCPRRSWNGTRVAGTIAAIPDAGRKVAGVAPQARIVPIRVAGVCDRAHVSDIADGLLFAANIQVPGGPINTNPANVIVLTFTARIGCPRILQDAISRVTFARPELTLVVSGTGRGDEDVQYWAPGNCQWVASAMAMDNNLLSFPSATWGRATHTFGAPGESNTTTDSGITLPMGPSSGRYASTVAAGSHLAGVGALLLARYPQLSWHDFVGAVMNTGRPPRPPRMECDPNCPPSINAAAAVRVNFTRPPAALGAIRISPPNTTRAYALLDWTYTQDTTHYIAQTSVDGQTWTGAEIDVLVPPVRVSGLRDGHHVRVKSCSSFGCSPYSYAVADFP